MDKILSRRCKYHRIVLKVPNITRCDILPIISGRMPLRCTLDLKFFTFYRSIASSKNTMFKYMATYMLNSYSSTMCENIRHIVYKYKININDILTMPAVKIRKFVYNKWFPSINSDCPIHANVIKDMLGKKEEWYTRILSNKQCKFLLEIRVLFSMVQGANICQAVLSMLKII